MCGTYIASSPGSPSIIASGDLTRGSKVITFNNCARGAEESLGTRLALTHAILFYNSATKIALMYEKSVRIIMNGYQYPDVATCMIM